MDKVEDLIKEASSLWTIEYKQKVIDLLKNWCRNGKKERNDYYCYQKYKIKVLGGLEEIVLKKDEKVMATKEMALSTIKNYHVTYGHKGGRVTHKKIQETYANINRNIINAYILQCERCTEKLKKKEKKNVVVCPIISKDFNERVQIDLVDYQSKPDGPYRYVFHYTDHLTKYHILRPLKSKCAIEVANILMQVFTDFGAPQILQSDNGREFTANIIQVRFNGVYYFSNKNFLCHILLLYLQNFVFFYSYFEKILEVRVICHSMISRSRLLIREFSHGISWFASVPYFRNNLFF